MDDNSPIDPNILQTTINQATANMGTAVWGILGLIALAFVVTRLYK